MKKRKKIIALLDRILRQDASCVQVAIKGCETGLTLYEGSYLYVPYVLCSDYVKSYKHVPGHLEIVSTAQPYEEYSEISYPGPASQLLPQLKRRMLPHPAGRAGVLLKSRMEVRNV